MHGGRVRMWRIYDDLIAAVPDGPVVAECLIGIHWTLVRSEATGMALTPFDRGKGHGSGGFATSGIGRRIAGMPVRELAGFVKSWNPFEASLGLAAINSVLNAPARVEKMLDGLLPVQSQSNAFLQYRDSLRGKRVAVIGRFPDLEQLGSICRLTVLERMPGNDDLPDPACEYVLPEQDFVFITATALINKTLPRLLELSRNAFTFLVGPSTPFAPALYGHGIDVLAGTVVIDQSSLWQAVKEGATWGIFDHGAQMVQARNFTL